MPKRDLIQSSNDADDEDYDAAERYLELIKDEKTAAQLVKALRKAKPRRYCAKDVLRASALPLLHVNNAQVQKDMEKIRAGKRQAPLLCVRDPAQGKLIVADGFHRLCAAYVFNEEAELSCKIV